MSSSGAFAIGSRATELKVVEALRARFVTEDDASAVRSVTYYDTFDWRLLRNQGSLETCEEDGAVRVVWQSTEGRRLHRLIGHPVPAFAEDLPEGPFRAALERQIEMRRLLPQVRIERRTKTFRILDRNQKTVARAVFERGTVLPSDGVPTRRRLPATLTIQPVRGYDEDRARITRYLENKIGLPAAATCALSRALDAIGSSPAERDSKIRWELEPEMTARDAVREILQALLATIRLNENGVRLDIDTEFLHDFRVAVRRTRSAMSQVKGVFAGERFDDLREEFRWLGGLTGRLRDLDVYILSLPEYRALLEKELRPGLDPLEVYLRREQHAEHGKIVAGLDSKRFPALLDGWEAFLAGADGDGARAGDRVIDVASRRIRRAFARVMEQGRAIEPETPATRLHELRIACKKLRYLLEFFSSLYPGGPVKRFIGSLKKLQDNLGRFNDLELQHETLEEISAQVAEESADPPGTRAAMERLTGALGSEQQAERDLFQKRFAQFATRENQDRARALFGYKERKR